MELCIVGWYGTETIGDRAILDGIIQIFLLNATALHISIGSLYPFFTERTVLEDQYTTRYPNVSIDIFDVYDERMCQKVIRRSDQVLMGGGPLMDLNEMYLILRVFEYARKKKKKTCLLGCGYGPLNQAEYIGAANHLIACADSVIFRDEASQKNYQEHAANVRSTIFLEDPAIISVLKYKETARQTAKEKIACVNFRDYPEAYFGEGSFDSQKAAKVLESLLSQTDLDIVLMPMHTFFIGGDDRRFFYDSIGDLEQERISVISQPMSLFETYSLIRKASLCIGMRYHSVVFQTILNSNNYVINYTNKDHGKITAFIHSIGGGDFYKDRTYHVSDEIPDPFFTFRDASFLHRWMSSDSIVKNYRKELGLRHE